MNQSVVKQTVERFAEIPGNTYQEKITHLNSCNCCERHKTHKPKIWHSDSLKDFNIYGSTSSWALCRGNGPDGFKDRLEERLKKCSCDCRHIARFMCRQWPHEFCPPSDLYIQEKRIDIDDYDCQLFSKKQFLDFYGEQGEKKWDDAIIVRKVFIETDGYMTHEFLLDYPTYIEYCKTTKDKAQKSWEFAEPEKRVPPYFDDLPLQEACEWTIQEFMATYGNYDNWFTARHLKRYKFDKNDKIPIVNPIKDPIHVNKYNCIIL